MAKRLTDEEILAQIPAARARAQTGPQAKSAYYDPSTGRVVVELMDGSLCGFPADWGQGLRDATPEQLAAVEVLPGGLTLHWEELDADLSVAGVVAGILGSRDWMREIGRAGGRVKSEAKAAAARENGRKGGRPRGARKRTVADPHADLDLGRSGEAADPSTTESQFVSAVRNTGVPQPTSKKFTPAEWKSHFSRIAGPEPADERLYRSGLFFYDRLAEVRARHADLVPVKLSPEEHVRLLVAAVNLTAELDVHWVYEQVPSGAEMPSLGPNAVHGPTMQSAGADMAARMVQLVDAVRHALPDTVRGSGSGIASRTERSADRDVLNRVGRELDLARAYDALETGWAECLWADYYVEPFIKDGIHIADTLLPSEWGREAERAIGDFRRDSLLVEFGIRAFTDWGRVPLAIRQSVAAEPVVLGVKWNEGRACPVVGARGVIPTVAPKTFLARSIAHEPYFWSLLSEPLPKLEGLTPRELLDTWAVLASLGEALANQLPKVGSESITSIEDALRWSPVVAREEMERALNAALGFNPEKARAALNAFVLPTGARVDPWTHPWVPVGADGITPLFNPLENGNLIRSLESWLNEGGLSLARRGKLFEEALRAELAADVGLPNASVFDRSVRVSVNGTGEEIDLVVRIGATFLVGECKCSVYPVGPHGYYTYERTLAGAAKQILRKAKFCEQHTEAFMAAVGVRDLAPSDVKIVPVVVSNVPHGVGRQFDNVPVADVYILSRYLDGGGNYRRMARVGPSGIEEGEAVRFYRSPEDAEANVAAYLADPPQLRDARGWLEPDLGALFPSGLLDRPIYRVDLRVRPNPPVLPDHSQTFSQSRMGGGQHPAKPSSHAEHDERKVGRNDPCPCGSGRKYKRCHGR